MHRFLNELRTIAPNHEDHILDQILNECELVFNQKNVIFAIKHLRNACRTREGAFMGLKDAKEFIDRTFRSEEQIHPSFQSGKQKMEAFLKTFHVPTLLDSAATEMEFHGMIHALHTLASSSTFKRKK